MPVSSTTSAAGFDWPVRVYYEDTDAGGVVYHARYLGFFERARTEWLRALGYEQDVLRASEGLLFVVRRIEIDYLVPVRFNACLTVRSTLLRLGGASMQFRQEIIRPDDGACCCSALVVVVCVDERSGRACRVPPALVATLSAANSLVDASPIRERQSS